MTNVCGSLTLISVFQRRKRTCASKIIIVNTGQYLTNLTKLRNLVAYFLWTTRHNIPFSGAPCYNTSHTIIPDSSIFYRFAYYLYCLCSTEGNVLICVVASSRIHCVRQQTCCLRQACMTESRKNNSLCVCWIHAVEGPSTIVSLETGQFFFVFYSLE